MATDTPAEPPDNKRPGLFDTAVGRELRQELSGIVGVGRVYQFPTRREHVFVEVANNETAALVRERAHTVLRKHNCRLKPLLPSDPRPTDIESHVVAMLEGIPFACHGFCMADRPQTDDRPMLLLPIKESECRNLTDTLGQVFSKSSNFDIVVAVATGGLSILHYLIGRWCWQQWGVDWPMTDEQRELSRQRFKALCGFRSGWGTNAFELGVEAISEILTAMPGGRVLIVDTTFHGSGTNTIMNVLAEAVPRSSVRLIHVAEVLDEDRLAGRTLPDFEIPQVGVPISLDLHATERIVMEDISEAIGFRQRPGERVLEPRLGRGVVVIERDNAAGILMEAGTLSELLRQMVDSPNLLSANRVEGLAMIDNKLREILRTSVPPKEIRSTVDSYLAGDFDAFELGRRVRSLSRNQVGAVTLSANSRATLPLLDKMNEAVLDDLKRQRLLDGRKP